MTRPARPIIGCREAWNLIATKAYQLTKDFPGAGRMRRSDEPRKLPRATGLCTATQRSGHLSTKTARAAAAMRPVAGFVKANGGSLIGPGPVVAGGMLFVASGYGTNASTTLPPRPLAILSARDSQSDGVQLAGVLRESQDALTCDLLALSEIPESRSLEQMMRSIRIVFLALCFAAQSHTADAQTAAPGSSAEQDWHITAYPVLAWVPLDIGIDVDVPPANGDGGGSGEILDSYLDGALFAGVAASNGVWRIDGYGLWFSFGGDRVNLPFLKVDMDLIYGSAKVGRRIARDLYATGGVRRVALDYDITLGDLPRFSRKPGIWDPIVGIGWHRVRPKLEWHAAFDGGGFGAGADVDLGASFSVDWKPIPHFGLTAGYNLLYLKITDSVVNRDVTMKLTAQGPTVGFGLYF